MTNFVRNSIDMFGFRNGNAFFQCVKELMDNAIDACKAAFILRQLDNFCIRCVIRRCSATREIEIEISASLI